MKPAILILLVVFFCGCGGTEPETDSPTPIFLDTWGSFGTDEGRFHQPTGICLDSNGNIYVADAQNARVQKFAPDGEFLSIYAGHLSFPLGVAVGPDGVVYVNDFFNTRIQRFAANGEFLGTWNYISALYGPVIDASNNVYISGYKVIARQPNLVVDGPFIWKLTHDGRELQKWESHGVSTITRDLSGNFYGLRRYHDSDDLPHSVVVKIQRGTLIDEWELNKDIPTAADGIALVNGHLYVTCRELGTGFVYKLSKSGRLLSKWSEVDGYTQPLGWPAGVAVDGEENIFVVDFTRYRIVKYGLEP